MAETGGFAARQRWRETSAVSEARQIGGHAAAVLVGQLAVMSYGIVDTMIAGRYATESLAALSVASAVHITVVVALMGVLQAQLPIWAEMHGAGRSDQIGPSVRQALYVWVAASVVGIAVLLLPEPLLHVMQVPFSLHAEVADYLRLLAVGLPAALAFRLFGTLSQAIGKPRVVTMLQLASLAVKVPLSIALCFGVGPLPGLGLLGCAIGTLAASAMLFLAGLMLSRSDVAYRECRLWHRLEPPDAARLLVQLRLGLPTAAAITVEVSSFTLMALLIARMGATQSAAHQIAANLAAVLYMAPLSISIAASARISFWIGSGEPTRANAALRSAWGWIAASALFLAVTVLMLREFIAGLYTGHDAGLGPVAAELLFWVALYHLADAAQTLCVFVLRCFRVTVLPLVIYTVSLWGVGLGVGHALATHPHAWAAGWPAGAAAYWSAGLIALVLAALTLLWRLRVASRSLQKRSDRSA